MYRLYQASLVLVTFLFAACDQPVADKPIEYSTEPLANAETTYRFAVHPLHNPHKLFEAYQPLIDHLNQQVQGLHFELEASSNYQVYEQKYKVREPAFLLANPWQTLQAIEHGYHVIAMAGDAEDFKGIFIVRKDSKIKSPIDIKGKVVSYPSHTALAAAIMPQYYLHMNGIDINHDIQNVYVGSQESSIMNVYLNKSAIGATWPPPWRLFQQDHPAEASQLQVIWETPPLINNSVMVRDDMPSNIQTQVTEILLNLAHTPEGKAILKKMETANMYAANNASYDVVRDYIQHFEQVVRPVERP